MFRCALIVAMCLATLPARAWTDEDKPDENTELKDHPAIPRFPRSILVDGDPTKDFDSYDFPMKPSDDGFKTKTVEGRVTHLVYDNPAAASATEIIRNYSNALTKAGFKIVLDYKDSNTDRTLSAERDTPHAWVKVSSYGFNDWTRTDLVVVEAKQMEQKIELDASAMLDEINKTGHVAVYGIQFATGKADITPDSAKVLGEIGKLLAQNAGLKLRIEGHTDNVGKSADNLALSKKRAAAVRDWLVNNQKVDGKRLTTDGFGDTRPVADNGSDDGRAKNRRVELVKL